MEPNENIILLSEVLTSTPIPFQYISLIFGGMEISRPLEHLEEK
jgi:hypothetical protein